MKKKNYKANIIMVVIISILAIAGVTAAWFLKKNKDNGIGSQYKITALKDNKLVEDGQDKTCTITIVCDTILVNRDSLDEKKLPYVPENGEILPKTTVSFADGDTVFEVLQKVCEATDIQLEYSWTPLYNNYYIEGIGHLYEFDCGAESGWMFKVNDTFPNYGCSSYNLEGGEDIVWCYTCNGLGEDVGAAVTGEN